MFRKTAIALLPFLLAVSCLAASVRLQWDPNGEPDLAGYRVHAGFATGTRNESRDVHLVTTIEWTGLVPGVTYFFTVTAYNAAGLESDPSNEVSYRVTVILPPVENYQPSP